MEIGGEMRLVQICGNGGERRLVKKEDWWRKEIGRYWWRLVEIDGD